MEYKTISFTEKGPIDVYYDAEYRCCLFCFYGHVEKMETTKMGTTIKMDAISTVILSVPVIHLKNAKGLDIPGFMKEIEKNVEHYNSR